MITVLGVASCFYRQSLKCGRVGPSGARDESRSKLRTNMDLKLMIHTRTHTNTHRKNSPVVITSSGEERRDGWRIVSVILTLKFVCVDPPAVNLNQNQSLTWLLLRFDL